MQNITFVVCYTSMDQCFFVSRQLSALPDHMMRCDHMTTFFGCGCSGHVKTQATKISNANAAKG